MPQWTPLSISDATQVLTHLHWPHSRASQRLRTARRRAAKNFLVSVQAAFQNYLGSQRDISGLCITNPHILHLFGKGAPIFYVGGIGVKTRESSIPFLFPFSFVKTLQIKKSSSAGRVKRCWESWSSGLSSFQTANRENRL